MAKIQIISEAEALRLKLDSYHLFRRRPRPMARVFRQTWGGVEPSAMNLYANIEGHWVLIAEDSTFGRTREQAILRANYAAPRREVRHADLKRSDDETAYKSECPECEEGLLLVQRDSSSFVLLRDDMCIHCWTRFRYTDEAINGEALSG